MGGYVTKRHNDLVYINEDLQREAGCWDITHEPKLIPLQNEEMVDHVTGTHADRAGPDISSRGLFSSHEKTFYDVRVFHPNAPSYQHQPLESLYKMHEKEKMRKYNSRILVVEKGSFTPLVYSTIGGWARQATSYHRRLADQISKRRNEDYSKVMNFMRTRISFSVLRSTLVAIRGDRGKRSTPSTPLSNVSFNLIPAALQYECY